MSVEPAEERAARRDLRTVEIARVMALLAITAVGLTLVLSLGGLGMSDILVTLVGLSAAATLVLAIRRVVRLRRSGL